MRVWHLHWIHKQYSTRHQGCRNCWMHCTIDYETTMFKLNLVSHWKLANSLFYASSPVTMGDVLVSADSSAFSLVAIATLRGFCGLVLNCQPGRRNHLGQRNHLDCKLLCAYIFSSKHFNSQIVLNLWGKVYSNRMFYKKYPRVFLKKHGKLRRKYPRHFL
jgi:hypothetical protein